MGFRMRWDVPQIILALRAAAAETASPYNDGFTAWHCKQDLLQVKYALEHMLKDLPTFSDEPLVKEVSLAGEIHGDPGGLGGLDNLGVAL